MDANNQTFSRTRSADATAGETRLFIDERALATNLRTIRRVVPAGVKICAVVKADAYGHGAATIARLICEIENESPFLRVDQFAVATFDEAWPLVAFGKPIMLLRPVENAFLGRQRDLIEAAVNAGWTLTLASPAAADDVARIALHLQKPANVQIMLDTGMTRCGVSLTQFERLLERILHHPSLRLVGLSTHFVNSEVANDSLTTRQLRLFEQTLSNYPILESIPRHAANSGAIFFTPQSHFEVVRPGICLYGVDPTGRPCVDRALVPVARWTAPIIGIHDVPAGGSVGYGQSWVANTAVRVAVLPVGYADGYPRSAGNKAVAVLHDQTCGVVGRVSMDMCAIDIRAVPDAVIGDDVTLIDNNPLSPASVYQLARIAETIPYEILSRIGPRVTRTSFSSTADRPAGEGASAA